MQKRPKKVGSLASLPRAAARALNTSVYSVDGDAKTRDDYEQEMHIFVLQLGDRPEMYVGRSVWNKVSKVQRDRARRTVLRQLFMTTAHPTTPDEAHELRERRLEESSCAALLETRLSREERVVLEQAADEAGTYRSAKYKAARTRALAILEEHHV